MRKCILLLLMFIWGALSCKKTKDTPDPIPEPVAAVQAFPLKNEECTAGTILSATESTIPFSWAPAANTDSYDITVKDLEAGTSITQSTTATSISITLKRNNPYSWYITSKSAKAASTAKSETWKFYNSGPGKASYAPFPAELLTPAAGQQITPAGGKITLDWNGSDVDNDIAGYDVYLGTAPTPTLLKGNVIESILTGVEVVSGATYYWKVITKDLAGNTSDSGIWQFKTN